ncbi:UNVERIFIED_CONTAM: hypothetical protein Sangu_2728300 [Sesamum angustifolium]|uniref:Uncharacterized protein n=1 Tax=Sesamum angustifolium TaxID=2727405 RepID=A0AAW2IYP2_9LAMI
MVCGVELVKRPFAKPSEGAHVSRCSYTFLFLLCIVGKSTGIVLKLFSMISSFNPKLVEKLCGTQIGEEESATRGRCNKQKHDVVRVAGFSRQNWGEEHKEVARRRRARTWRKRANLV